MTKRVYPNASAPESPKPTLSTAAGDRHSAPPPPETLTVWRKSLLFNCNGFTVFDTEGNLVFRVDKYAKSRNSGEIVLMDAAGNPLLTVRRKILSLIEQWQIYEGEQAANPILSVRKNLRFLHSKSLAQVTPSPGCGGGGVYAVEGSYGRRCCVVYDERRRAMVEIRRKETKSGVAFGIDVFRLVVQPDFDAPVAMAIVILLDEMFRSRSWLVV
ncbi:Protein LURP-one-related 8 [Platanthera guangdongensis]|uniref:Protein LURP-one-related 8 n=1 Tax=Platanthera guangdongensis TaxID=2320717 RepID=A0ABR2MJY0_9ASPA